MKCPHCNTEIPGIACSECNESIPEDSSYCLYCGAALKDYSTGVDDSAGVDDSISAEDADDLDLENRIPCMDGNCIGIIIDGKCNICGKRYKGKKK